MTDTLVHLLAGQKPDGELIYEDIKAKSKGDGCYELLASPVFCRGAAKGDLIRTLLAGRFEIEQHGGNLCIRVIAKKDIDIIEKRLSAVVTDIEAECEVKTERLLVYNVKVKQGFDKIEKTFNQALEGHDEAMWLYANVYDAVDGETPLNWWHDYLAK